MLVKVRLQKHYSHKRKEIYGIMVRAEKGIFYNGLKTLTLLPLIHKHDHQKRLPTPLLHYYFKMT